MTIAWSYIEFYNQKLGTIKYWHFFDKILVRTETC